ncbi:hypothetical protein EYD10_12424 [Varanus komodoensis]|uniref:cilia- and flagella-associated protein 157 n=1 Tax=Varanus komodoensis TaxID=61221 RepID=UPI001CF7A3CF|nr:cilia- and flagella-associated protein 157 [Varanus komodoensis]KAF7240989.1 hypothetical protein EYD10_12424 [Varanus komodoensis]
MAPKKKGGRKKEEAPKEPEVDDNIVPEHSREFYLIQIRDLEGRLARYQQKWDELQVSDDLFRAEYEKMVGDNKEIVAFLKKTLNQRVDEIAELSLQLQLLQQAKDSEKDAFEAQLAQLRHEFQETKDMLTSENMALSGKLAALEEFRIQKDELMAKFSDLEEQLTRQEENHKEYVYNLEKKTVIDKERLKKEMLHRVNAVAAEFRKVSNSQMAETTKRTIRENVTISLQLTKITEQSLQLIQENDRLKEAHTRTLKQLDLLEQNERRMAKTSVSNQKLIWMLTTKCKELQAQVDEHLQVKRVLAQTQKTNEVLEQQNQALREELSAQKDELARKMAQEQDRGKSLQDERQRRLMAEQALRHAARGLKEVLAERPLDGEADVDVILQLRRNDALHGILTLLRRSIERIEADQALRPFLLDSKLLHVPSAMDSPPSELRVRPVPTMSHFNIFKFAKSRPAHSLPSLSSLSRTHVDTLRPFASAKEPLIALWKAEMKADEEKLWDGVVQKGLSLPETVGQRASQELLGK